MGLPERPASGLWPSPLSPAALAGARTPEAMTTADIRRLIRAAGREPVERDTLYNVITGPEAPDEVAVA